MIKPIHQAQRFTKPRRHTPPLLHFRWLGASLIMLIVIGLLGRVDAVGVGGVAVDLSRIWLSAYKLTLVSAAAWIGYWVDCTIFPYAKPSRLLGFADDGRQQLTDPLPDTSSIRLASVAMIRRSIIIGMAMIAVSVGL